MMEGTADPDAALAAAHAEYEAAMESSAHTESDSSGTDDNDGENGIQKARRRRRKPYPGYFFPQLSQQRMVYCLDVLKREDIKSVSNSCCSSQSSCIASVAIRTVLLARKGARVSVAVTRFRKDAALGRAVGQHRESALYLTWTIRSDS